MNLIQISPGLLPIVDGIGDRFHKTARRLRERHGIVARSYAGGISKRTRNGFVEAATKCREAYAAVLGDLRAADNVAQNVFDVAHSGGTH